MSEYTAVPSSGKLKLKGVKDARVDKKKKKKRTKPDGDNDNKGIDDAGEDGLQDKSLVVKQLEDEDEKITKEDRRQVGVVDGKEMKAGAGVEDEDLRNHLKTEAERRHEERRKKRLEDRLKKEGFKTHKERVEELNKYLSNLSEHHDMPKIGPG